MKKMLIFLSLSGFFLSSTSEAVNDPTNSLNSRDELSSSTSSNSSRGAFSMENDSLLTSTSTSAFSFSSRISSTSSLEVQELQEAKDRIKLIAKSFLSKRNDCAKQELRDKAFAIEGLIQSQSPLS